MVLVVDGLSLIVPLLLLLVAREKKRRTRPFSNKSSTFFLSKETVLIKRMEWWWIPRIDIVIEIDERLIIACMIWMALIGRKKLMLHSIVEEMQMMWAKKRY